MRILFCNKYNYPFSGTEVYLFEAIELMRSKGHEVALFSMADPRGSPTAYDRHFVPHIDFKKRRQWFQKVGLAGRAIYSREARRRIRPGSRCQMARARSSIGSAEKFCGTPETPPRYD